MSQPLDRGGASQPYPCKQALKDDELLRYVLDRDPLPFLVEEHIARCNSCHQQLESLVSLHYALQRRLYRCRCPDVTVLARYSASLASLNEGLLVLYHLPSCPLCTQELQEMRNILENEAI